MLILKKISELELFLNENNSNIKAFIPTMGALHSGHAALITAAQKDNNVTICSIFVNPLQFNNQEDLKSYPQTLERDIAFLKDLGCDAVFIPSASQIYPPDYTPININLGVLDQVFEGQYRPGHFLGVACVLHRLFTLINPDLVYLGIKDFQQCLVVQKLVDQFFPTMTLHWVPTVRDSRSGLALSSRNARLSEQGIVIASQLYLALKATRNAATAHQPPEAIKIGLQVLIQNNIQVEYFTIVDSQTLIETNVWEPEKKYIILSAIYVEGIRLIDNMFI